MPTIDQIAQQLGLSIATVSRALNDKPGVKKETRDRVLRQASQMDYGPNMAARSLATNQTRSIGFLCSPGALTLWTDPFYLHVMHGAERELTRLGFFLMVHTLFPNDLTSAADIQLLREKRVDGVIVASPFFSQRFILSIKSSDIPIVLVDNELAHTPVNTIQIADEEGGYQATRHLIDHGHTHIALISGCQEWVSCRNRTAGYKRAIEEAHLSPCIDIQEATTLETGYCALINVFRQDQMVSAVFCQNDAMAVGAIRAAGEKGKRIPQDLAIVGFDDIELALHTALPLTTMHVPKEYLGVLAARRIVDILTVATESQQPPVTNLVNTELVIRSSCGCSH